MWKWFHSGTSCRSSSLAPRCQDLPEGLSDRPVPAETWAVTMQWKPEAKLFIVAFALRFLFRKGGSPLTSSGLRTWFSPVALYRPLLSDLTGHSWLGLELITLPWFCGGSFWRTGVSCVDPQPGAAASAAGLRAWKHSLPCCSAS